jgi:hypothetical protein
MLCARSNDHFAFKENFSGAHDEDTVFAWVKPSCSTVFARISLLADTVFARVSLLVSAGKKARRPRSRLEQDVRD